MYFFHVCMFLCPVESNTKDGVNGLKAQVFLC